MPLNHELRWGLKDCIIIWVFVIIGSNLFSYILSPWHDTSLLTFFTFSSVVQTSLILFLVFFDVIVLHRQGLQNLGLGIRNAHLSLLEGFFWGILLFLVVLMTGIIISLFSPQEPSPQPIARLILEIESPGQLWLPLVLAVVLAPLGEEVFFRGFFYPVLRRYLGVAWGIIGSSLFFGLMHLDLFRFIPLVIGSMMLTWLYEKTNSLYTSIIAHGTWNAMMIFILVISENQLT